jgi:hypothetical protein
MNNMPAQFLHPGFARRLPVSWYESQWTLAVRLRRRRQSKQFKDHQPTVFPFSIHRSPQPGTSARSQDDFSRRLNPVPAFKSKLSRDKRIDPS